MLLLHDRAEPGDDFLVRVGHIVFFTGIGGEVVELDDAGPLVLCLGVGIYVPPNRLPIAHAHALLAAGVGRLAVEEGTRLLLVTQQGGRETEAVQASGRCVFGTN